MTGHLSESCDRDSSKIGNRYNYNGSHLLSIKKINVEIRTNLIIAL